MKDIYKTKKQLIEELDTLRDRIAELETEENQQKDKGEIFNIIRYSTPIGLFIVQDGKFVFVNKNFRGATAGDTFSLIGTNSRNLVLPEDREMVRENAIKMLKGERTSPYKYRLITHGGEIRWMLEGVASTKYHGKRAVLGNTMDITEREEAQGKLEEMYEKEKNLRKDLELEVKRRIEFTRALVHELKTPLTPIMSSSELLLSELKEEPWASLASNIYRGATNLSNRIDELLDLARGEIGMLSLNSREVNILRLLKDISGEMSVVALSNGQTLVSELPPSLPLVWGDEERIRQVILNLLINASKFMPEGGTITLKAKAQSGTVVVEIHDTGPGISKEEQQRLFIPYNRKLGDREHLSGLGLGLALSKNLVELHGGTIWINSDTGKGSTFGFSIPLNPPAQK